MFNHTVEFINDQSALLAAVDRINDVSAIALDIETIYWWDRELERVSIIQIAFRESGKIRVIVIDAMAGIELEALRRPLELSLTIKAIHNASFDAVKMARHFQFSTSPIYDTMLAARRSGERRCSLQAQVERRLGYQLNKTEQRSDWSRRPLSPEQLNYASLDAVCTLLLYETQIAHGLRGDYELRARVQKTQESLPLMPTASPAGKELRITTNDSPAPVSDYLRADAIVAESGHSASELNACALALLGVVAELSGRYSPSHLIASVGSERIGLAGWIIDHTVGVNADIEEDAAKIEIATLHESGLVRLGPSRKLEVTTAGAKFWRDHKPGV
jgi:hypothetical protein